MDDVMAVCDLGHQFVWRDFVVEEAVVAQIRQCPEMVAKSEHFGLVLECGARVLWIKGGLTSGRRKFILPREKRGEQLDLFASEIDPLTKLSE